MSSKKKEGFKLFLLILPFLILCFLFSYLKFLMTYP